MSLSKTNINFLILRRHYIVRAETGHRRTHCICRTDLHTDRDFDVAGKVNTTEIRCIPLGGRLVLVKLSLDETRPAALTTAPSKFRTRWRPPASHGVRSKICSAPNCQARLRKQSAMPVSTGLPHGSAKATLQSRTSAANADGPTPRMPCGCLRSALVSPWTNGAKTKKETTGDKNPKSLKFHFRNSLQP